MESPTVTEICQSCGDEFESPERFAGQTDVCEACHKQKLEDELAEVVRGETDEAWGHVGRAEAIKRLQTEFDALPLRVDDGKWLVEADIEYGRGIGAEPCGYWVESSEHRVERECPECEYPMARRSFKAHAGHERMHVVECDACGYTHESSV